MKELKFGSIYEEFKVNENGDTIKIPIGDDSFRDSIWNLAESWEVMCDEYQKKEDERTKGIEDANKISKIRKDLEDEFTEKTRKEIDALFGEGTLKKCYPDAQKLNITMVGDFFGVIIPAIFEAREERGNKVNMVYNRNRKGARSKRV